MTSKYESFKLEIESNIANIILSRPEQLNSMSRKFWVELPEILEEVNRNSEIRVLIISSTGKHFCAGMDLSAFDNGVANIPKEKRPDNARIGEALYRSAKELQEYISKLEKIRVPVNDDLYVQNEEQSKDTQWGKIKELDLPEPEKNEIELWISLIQDLLKNEKQYSNLAKNAKKTMLETYDQDKLFEKLLDILSS